MGRVEIEFTWYAGHCWPIVPSLDADECETYPSATLSTTNPTWPDVGRRCVKPATSQPPELWHGLCESKQRSGVLLKKPPVAQLIDNVPLFNGAQWYISVLTRAHDLSLSWASSIQPTPSHPISLILILSLYLHVGISSGLFRPKVYMRFSALQCVLHVLPISLIISVILELSTQFILRRSQYLSLQVAG
jgi:hypothetical protein